MKQCRGAPQTGRRSSGAALELQLSRSNEKRLHGDYEGRPHACFSRRPNTCSQHCLANYSQASSHFYQVFNKLVNASTWCSIRTSSRKVAYICWVYSVILYQSGTNKVLNGSYWYLNVDSVEPNKTLENKGVTIEHFRHKEK